MKSTLQFIIVFLFIGCMTEKDTQLTETQKREITEQINSLWNQSCEAVENLNAEGAFAIWNSDPNSKYIREAHLYTSIDEARKQYAKWFSHPQPKRKLEYQSFDLNILDKNTAIITAIATLTTLVDSTDNKQIWKIGFTVVWRKERAGWRVINMHTSIPNK
jgi:ketosteroid isomerase-like protein